MHAPPLFVLAMVTLLPLTLNVVTFFCAGEPRDCLQLELDVLLTLNPSLFRAPSFLPLPLPLNLQIGDGVGVEPTHLPRAIVSRGPAVVSCVDRRLFQRPTGEPQGGETTMPLALFGTVTAPLPAGPPLSLPLSSVSRFVCAPACTPVTHVPSPSQIPCGGLGRARPLSKLTLPTESLN